MLHSAMLDSRPRLVKSSRDQVRAKKPRSSSIVSGSITNTPAIDVATNLTGSGSVPDQGEDEGAELESTVRLCGPFTAWANGTATRRHGSPSDQEATDSLG